MNEVTLMGRMVADPELRRAKTNNEQVTSFTVAVPVPTKKDDADYIDCVAFEKTAETICRYWHKGKPIIIHGHLQVRSWNDDKGGSHKQTEVIVNRVEFTISEKRDDEEKC